MTKDHIIEIFSNYGEVKGVDFPTDRFHPYNGRGFCYVEFANSDDAENAMKHMDGGQIDGCEVAVSPVNNPKPMNMRRSPMRRGGPMMNRNRWKDNRFRNRRSPIRRSPRRR